MQKLHTKASTDQHFSHPKILVLLVMPRLAELACSLGLEFTSPEFNFFRDVISHTLHTRQENNLQRGDFLDMLLETRAHGKEGKRW